MTVEDFCHDPEIRASGGEDSFERKVDLKLVCQSQFHRFLTGSAGGQECSVNIKEDESSIHQMEPPKTQAAAGAGRNRLSILESDILRLWFLGLGRLNANCHGPMADIG